MHCVTWSDRALNGACPMIYLPLDGVLLVQTSDAAPPVRTIHDLAQMLDRMYEQCEVVLSDGIVDSQSIKAPGAHKRGYNSHKKISGRKPHITVDSDG
jgi:hypothetical protein